MSKAKKRPIFTGAFEDLSKPIILPPMPPMHAKKASEILLGTMDAIDEKAVEQWRKEFVATVTKKSCKNFGLLFDWYGINKKDNERWFMLAFNMARDYIPAFSVVDEGKRGRPKKWDETKYLELYLNVNKKMREKGDNNLSRACRGLVKKNGGPMSAKTLSNMYLQSKDSHLVKIIDSLVAHSKFTQQQMEEMIVEFLCH
jgi:hypothetical protein